MAKAKLEQFTSRWALLLATLGMAVGAGNIWRFPRLAGQYGGAFLIPWAIFLILWSIPLLMVEFSLGKETRKGPVGAFAKFLGPSFTWMGAFVVLCTMAIMFYYAVVSGWALKYFVAAASGSLMGTDHHQYWSAFTATGNIEPVFYHFIALSLAAAIIFRGVVMGIEKANRILLPLLFGLLLLGVFRSLTLDNAAIGLNYLFGFQGSSLLNPNMWLEALSQSAWSTGAGWGLVLTYSVYMRAKEDVTLNAFITGFGNNTASLLAALAIIPAVFSLAGSTEAATAALQAGNSGLSFIVLPQLFENLPGARILTALFFLALFSAALSSLIAMFELSTRFFMDFGIARGKALGLTAGLTAVLGLPSALSQDFFNNQDWVWGLGLILSGSFFAFAVLRKGVSAFRLKYLAGPNNDLTIGAWYDWIMRYLIPLEALAILLWWFYQTWNGDSWWNPTDIYSLGTCLVQWGTVLAILGIGNRKLYSLIEMEG